MLVELSPWLLNQKSKPMNKVIGKSSSTHSVVISLYSLPWFLSASLVVVATGAFVCVYTIDVFTTPPIHSPNLCLVQQDAVNEVNFFFLFVYWWCDSGFGRDEDKAIRNRRRRRRRERERVCVASLSCCFRASPFPISMQKRLRIPAQNTRKAAELGYVSRR